jgi:hypothetical protein
MEILYSPASFFVWHPERAWAIAIVFFIAFFVSLFLSRHRPTIKSWTISVPAIAWTIFGLLELSSKVEKSNIRIDLLFTWPAIIGVLIIFTYWWIISLLGRSRKP